MHRLKSPSIWVLALSLPLLSVTEAAAQAPAPVAAPRTLWNWLGIPSQPGAGIINRGGNFPECEKKPALKAIADPANLASKDPAIAKAAEIKAQEDLAAQKIKAIKYLATIGCGGCYEGVDKALAAALDDCTEAVRYEAVKAILAASACGQNDCVKKCVRQTKTCKEAMCDGWVGCMKRTCATMHLLCGKPGPDGVTLKSKCPGYACQSGPQNCQSGRCACGDGNCCTSEILNKLSTMAFERDDRGCWKEPSPRVRAMARQALRACGPNVRPYTGVETPAPEEVSVEPDAPASAPASGRTPEQGGSQTPESGNKQEPAAPSKPEAVETPAAKSAEATEVPELDETVEVQVSEVIAPAGPTQETAVAGFGSDAVVDIAEVETVTSVPVATDSEVAETAPQNLDVVVREPLQEEVAATAIQVDAELPLPPSPEDLFSAPASEQPVKRVATAHMNDHKPRSQAAGSWFFGSMFRSR